MPMTETEERAIADWLKRNKVTKCPLGGSGIYDEFGEPLAMTPRAYARIARKVRRVHKTENLTVQALAVRLGCREMDVRTACAKHRIEVVDAPPKKRRRKKA